MPTYLLATLQSQFFQAQLIKNFWEIITSSSSPVLLCFSSALHLLFQLSSLWRFFFLLGWGLRFPCLWLVKPGAGWDVVFRWSHLCSSIRKEGKESEKNERSHIIFIYFCCFTCTTQLQAPVEMSAAPQKYHFQVERQIFSRLQFVSTALFFFVFRGQIYSAYNLNILGRWSQLTSLCSVSTLLWTRPSSCWAIFSFSSRPLRKESAGF